MKILIVMTGFFPGKKYGGPPVSVNNFCTLLDKEECFIVTRNHDMGEKNIYQSIEKGWNKQKNCEVLYLSDEEYNYQHFEMLINEIQPDILYLQGLFQSCIFPCLKIAKKYRIKVLLAPRGELCEGAFKKKYKKLPYIWMLKKMYLLQDVYCQSTSREETVAIKKYLKKENKKIYCLPNIPSIPSVKLHEIRKEVGTAKFIFMSRIVSKKNLNYVLECLGIIRGNVLFDIYGPIEDEGYWDRCQKTISQLPNNIKVSYKGIVSHDRVHEIFNQYHAFIFPTHSENYGHVIAESIVSGCPIIVSDQTPWGDIEDNGGWAIPLENKNRFVQIMQGIVDNDVEKQLELQKKLYSYAEKKFRVKCIRQEYEKMLKQIVQK